MSLIGSVWKCECVNFRMRQLRPPASYEITRERNEQTVTTQVAVGEVDVKQELAQTVEKYQPLTKLARRLSRLDEIPWMQQAGDIKTSLETIKQVSVRDISSFYALHMGKCR